MALFGRDPLDLRAKELAAARWRRTRTAYREIIRLVEETLARQGLEPAQVPYWGVPLPADPGAEAAERARKVHEQLLEPLDRFSREGRC
jgi:hypothetical protein